MYNLHPDIAVHTKKLFCSIFSFLQTKLRPTSQILMTPWGRNWSIYILIYIWRIPSPPPAVIYLHINDILFLLSCPVLIS